MQNRWMHIFHLILAVIQASLMFSATGTEGWGWGIYVHLWVEFMYLNSTNGQNLPSMTKVMCQFCLYNL